MLIEIGIAAGIGGIVGFGVCALFTNGKVDDLALKLWEAEMEAATENELGFDRIRELRESRAAHTRCADALTTTQRKLSAIRGLLDKPRTIRKGELASILDGDV